MVWCFFMERWFFSLQDPIFLVFFGFAKIHYGVVFFRGKVVLPFAKSYFFLVFFGFLAACLS